MGCARRNGAAINAQNLALCRDLLRQKKTQRQIAVALGVSLVTVNHYCKRIAKEIEEESKAARAETLAKSQKARERKRRVKETQEREIEELKAVVEQKEPPKTAEELAKMSFAACLLELRARLPSMTDEQVCKITVDLWDRVAGTTNG